MKQAVDRSGWSIRRMVLDDVKYLPRFLLGLAPQYAGECSSTFESEPMDPLYGGWATYCGIITLTVAMFAGIHFAPDVIRDFHSPSAFGSVMAVIMVPVDIAVFLVAGFIMAQIAAFPFLMLNSLFDAGERAEQTT